MPASPCGGSPSPSPSPSALMTSCASSSVEDRGRVLPGAAGSAIVVSLCLRAGGGVRMSRGCCVGAWVRCSLWGWRMGVPGGGRFPALREASGVRRCPSPGRPSSGALAPLRCSLWGWRKGVPEGGAFHHCGGRLRPGAVPPPTARPLGGLLGSATHVLWARVCGCGGPTLSPRPACPAGAACRGVGGGPATVARGAWCQALSLPRPPVLWSGQLGFRGPCVPGAVGVGVGTQQLPHSVRLCWPALLAVGVAEGRPRGGCLLPL